MGNFSRNTFDKLKHYVGVRLQQGVPIVDADWNELEDIRKYELQAFLKWYVGNGVPSGNNGFQILPAFNSTIGVPPIIIFIPNDFVIRGGDGTPEGAGRCLVEGQDAIIESTLRYTAQRLFQEAGLNEAWNVAPLPALTTPAANRTDTVYLDVWEREVNSAEDLAQLVNPAIGIETCVRLKREWVVRVEEGATAPPAPPAGHAHYVLAQLARTAGEAHIFPAQIADRRRTGLSVPSYSDISQITQDAFGPSYSLGHQGQRQLPVSLRDAINAVLWGRFPTTQEHIVDSASGYFGNVAIVPYFENPYEDALFVWIDNGKAMYAWVNQASGMGTPTRLTNDTAIEYSCIALRDGDSILVFWLSDRANPGQEYRLYSSRFTPGGGWGPVTAAAAGSTTRYWNVPASLRDSHGNIWLAWVDLDQTVRLSRYANGNWSTVERASNPPYGSYGGTQSELDPAIIEGKDGTVLLFWQVQSSSSGYVNKIWYRRYSLDSGNVWQKDDPKTLTTDATKQEMNATPFQDGSNNIWLFWTSYEQTGPSSSDYVIYYKKFTPDGFISGADGVKVCQSTYYVQPIVFDARLGNFSVFWKPNDSGNGRILYKNYDLSNDSWSNILGLPSKDGFAPLCAGADTVGGAWLAYARYNVSNYQLVFKKVYAEL